MEVWEITRELVDAAEEAAALMLFLASLVSPEKGPDTTEEVELVFFD